MLLLFFLMLLNAAISCWNAYAAGRMWPLATGFQKAVTWSALIMSVCGFLMVAVVVLGFGAAAAHLINPKALNALMGLTYLMIIVPVLGSGTIITLHSWAEAYRRKDFMSVGTAVWNTYAMGKDIYDAADGGVSSAFKAVSNLFSSDDDDDSISSVFVLLILLVGMVIAGGLTYVLFQKGKRVTLGQLRSAGSRVQRPAFS